VFFRFVFLLSVSFRFFCVFVFVGSLVSVFLFNKVYLSSLLLCLVVFLGFFFLMLDLVCVFVFAVF